MSEASAPNTPTSPRHQLTSPGQTLRFITAGRAIVTLVSRKTGDRRTFRVRTPKEIDPRFPPTFFIDLLVGSDNENDYRYLGWFRPQSKGPAPAGAMNKRGWGQDAWRIFTWFLCQLHGEKFHPQLEVWHEGRCAVCGRTLTDPESIERGIGPVCFEKTGV